MFFKNLINIKEEKKDNNQQFFFNKSFGSPSKSIRKAENKDSSQKKNTNMLAIPKSKTEFDSSKSNTPKSPVSADWNLETKSNMDKKFINPKTTIKKRQSENGDKLSPLKLIKSPT